MDLLERRHANRGSRSSRDQSEGFALGSKLEKKFQPLGNPQIIDSHEESAKIDRIGTVQQQDGNQQAKNEFGRTSDCNWRPSQVGDIIRRSPIDADNGKDGSGASPRSVVPLANLPHGLYGKDLPRCSPRRQLADGLHLLRASVRRSDERLLGKRVDCDAACDASVSAPEHIFPVKEHYVRQDLQRALPSTGDLQPPNVPCSARPPLFRRQFGAGSQVAVSQLDVKMRFTPRRGHLELPSLVEHLSAASGATGSSDRHTHGVAFDGHGQGRVREQVEKLMSYGISLTGGVIRDEKPKANAFGSPRNRHDVDRSKKLDKILEKREREFHEKVIRRTEEERKKDYGNATSPSAPVTTPCSPKTVTTADGEATEAQVEGGGQESHEVPMQDQTETMMATETNDTAEVKERRKKRRRPAGESMSPEAIRSAMDHPDSCVARLRSALHAYQKTRADRLTALHNQLFNAEVNRTNALRNRPTLCEALETSDGTDDQTTQLQYNWYKGLLLHFETQKCEATGIVHFILDTVKSILEHECFFKPEALYTILAQLENNEVDKAVARLVVQMVRGLEGVSMPDVIAWYEKHRNSVPKHLRENVELMEDPGIPLSSSDVEDPDFSDEKPDEARSSRCAVTFVTEADE